MCCFLSAVLAFLYLQTQQIIYHKTEVFYNEEQYNMSEKQNYKFVLDRIFPQYFKPHLLYESSQETKRSEKKFKSVEEKRIQSKLKNIIYNLEREVQEQTSNTKNNNKFVRSNTQESKGKSFSQRSLQQYLRNSRYQTEIQSADLSENTERTKLIKKLRRKEQKQELKKQQQALILPKLTLQNQKLSRASSKNSLKSLEKIKRQYDIEKLDRRDKQLGRIVLEKVEKYFNLQKDRRKRYYDRVKSQQGIDQSLVCYLKNKVMKADAALQKK